MGVSDMTPEEHARAFARRFPRFVNNDGTQETWDQKCGSLVFRYIDREFQWAQQPVSDISSARRAANGSGTLNLDAAAAPPLAFHFWDIAGIDNGHVGVGMTQGGGKLFMANASVSEDLGDAIGFASVDHYTQAKAPRATYLGWATNYAGGRPNASVAAASNVKEKEYPMFSIIPLVNQGIWAQSTVTGRRTHIGTPYHLRLLQRMRDNDGSDAMLPAELDIVRGYLEAIGPDTLDAISANELIEEFRPEFDKLGAVDQTTPLDLDEEFASRVRSRKR
ncbi:hypothetical protein ACFPER_07525 [Agromyces aurantiacus]|uniref:Uncharacterized protein n=1 Tax=Agromyces aurantiacus TaxID=165814 RepID=A0ABV9R566_9MICO|nr:hypothetical protein [Agromyces aurantiacus]MBM7503314.1 hypothetical protein [Agromyces aurantiacus]